MSNVRALANTNHEETPSDWKPILTHVHKDQAEKLNLIKKRLGLSQKALLIKLLDAAINDLYEEVTS